MRSIGAVFSVLAVVTVFAVLAVSCTRSSADRRTSANAPGSVSTASHVAGEYDGKPLSKIPVIATFKYPEDFRVITTQGDLVKRWGKPNKITKEDVKSPYDPNTVDIRYKLEYDGFFFLLYHATAKNQDLLVATTITSPQYEVSTGLRVGMYKSTMLAKMGDPTFVEKNSYVYAAGLSSTDHMNKEFILSGDTVSRIVIYPEMP